MCTPSLDVGVVLAPICCFNPGNLHHTPEDKSVRKLFVAIAKRDRELRGLPPLPAGEELESESEEDPEPIEASAEPEPCEEGEGAAEVGEAEGEEGGEEEDAEDDVVVDIPMLPMPTTTPTSPNEKPALEPARKPALIPMNTPANKRPKKGVTASPGDSSTTASSKRPERRVTFKFPEITPSPTAGPSGLQPVREALWEKQRQIRELEIKLGLRRHVFIDSWLPFSRFPRLYRRIHMSPKSGFPSVMGFNAHTSDKE